MNIPSSCGKCKYGETFDLSVDDLCTYCVALGYGGDWTDYPHRQDGTVRMKDCPLSDLTNEEVIIINKKLARYNLEKGLVNIALHGKTKLIRKRNWGRLDRLEAKEMKEQRRLLWR